MAQVLVADVYNKYITQKLNVDLSLSLSLCVCICVGLKLFWNNKTSPKALIPDCNDWLTYTFDWNIIRVPTVYFLKNFTFTYRMKRNRTENRSFGFELRAKIVMQFVEKILCFDAWEWERERKKACLNNKNFLMKTCRNHVWWNLPAAWNKYK